MKILIIHYSEITSPGGVHKTIVETAKNLSKKGHEVVVLQGNPLGYPEQEIFEGFKIIRVKSRIAEHSYGFSPEIYISLNKIIKEIDPEIIHVHGYHTIFSPGVMFTLKLIKLDIPIIFSPHFDIQSHNTIAGKYLWNFYNSIIGKRYLKIAREIICASKFEAENIKNFGIKSDKIIKISHGVNKLESSKQKDKNIIKLLYVGYLLELKGIQYILATIHELRYTFKKKVLCEIVGDGDFKLQLMNLAKDLRIDDSINWNSSLYGEKLYEKFRESDIFLLLSLSENYGIVVAEALGFGKPCIVTTNTALNEFTDEPGCFGVQYPPDPKEVAKLVIKIHENDIKVGPFSEKIRTWDKITENYEEIYIKLQ